MIFGKYVEKHRALIRYRWSILGKVGDKGGKEDEGWRSSCDVMEFQEQMGEILLSVPVLPIDWR